MIRISEAFAKMRLSLEVNEDDVEKAVEIIRKATQHAATDPITGMIDMDAILTGKTASSRLRIQNLK
jgi:DNA replication licensing factor MCM4